jgi:hypothetical protein
VKSSRGLSLLLDLPNNSRRYDGLRVYGLQMIHPSSGGQLSEKGAIMNKDVDRRQWSITPRGLSEFVGDLARQGITSTSVMTLHRIFKERGIYPARDFADRCKPVPPDAFFTYHSAQNFVDIQEIVWQAFDFAILQLREQRPDLKDVDLEPLIADDITLWVDFIFIDQSARDIRRELDVLPALLNGAKAHFVLGT